MVSCPRHRSASANSHHHLNATHADDHDLTAPIVTTPFPLPAYRSAQLVSGLDDIGEFWFPCASTGAHVLTFHSQQDLLHSFRVDVTASHCTVPASACLHRAVRSSMPILDVCGEFCIFNSFRCVLTISASFSVVFVLFPMMCTSMPMFNLSVRFPTAFG